MQPVARTFFRGLLAFLPVFVTVYAVYYLGAWLNRVSNQLLALVLPELAEVPGLGILVGVVGLLLLGLLVSSRLTRWIYHVVETPLRKLPIIKELYTALKQLTDYLSQSDDTRAGQVVAVRHPQLELSLIGLLMRRDTGAIGLPAADAERVAVYLPMSYQVGGFTVFVPRDWVTTIDMPVETAMRETLTGWLEPTAESP